MFRRIIAIPLSLLVVFASILLSSSYVEASTIYPSDDGGWPKDYFYANEAVYVSGDLDPIGVGDIPFPRARIYVTEDLEWNGWEAIEDVTLHGYYSGYNVVIGNMGGGTFLGSLVWGPPLKVGNYDMIIDEQEDGLYDPNIDTVIGAGVGGISAGFAFTVLPPNGPNLYLGDVKKSAEGMAEYYEGYAARTSALVNVTRGQEFSPVITYTKSPDGKQPESGFSGSEFVSLKTYGEVMSVVESSKASYNSTMISIGFKILRRLASGQMEKYKGLASDPPDPGFKEFVQLGEMESQPVLGNTTMELAQVALSDELARQTAIVAALTSSIEKYTAARNAEDGYYTLMQAKAAKKYADMAVQSLENIKQLLTNLKNEIQTGEFERVLTANDVNDLQSFKQRISTSGFSATEIAILSASGMTTDDIDDLKNEIIGANFPAMQDISLAGILGSLAANNDQDKTYFTNLSANLQNIINHYVQYALVKHPNSNPGGPYAGNAGVPVNLDGSASINPTGGNLKYEWDLNGDGEFDDAEGANVQYTWNSAFSGFVGLKVTNIPKPGAPAGGTDFTDIAYAQVNIQEVNRPPVITSVTPENFNLTLAPNTALLLKATATDPDNDPITYTWELDGLPVANGNQWNYVPKPSETGSRLVVLRVSDNNPISRDSFESWRVLVNTPPNAVDDDYSVDADKVLDVAKPGVLSNDQDTDGDPLSVIGVDTSATVGLVNMNDDGSFSYDPNGKFDNLAPGQKATDAFKYTISDGTGGTDTATVTINITGVKPNTPPDALDDLYSTDANESLNIVAPGVLANDKDDDNDPLKVTSTDTSNTVGVVNWNENGSFSYNPNGKFDPLKAGEKADDTFTYTISDGRKGTDTATATITVTGLNEVPVAVDDLYFVNSNAFLLINAPGVLTNDNDIDNDPLKITNVDKSNTVGIIRLNENGSFFYDPNGKFDYLEIDQTAEDKFSYTMSDGSGGTDTAIVTIKITGVGSAPPSLEVEEAIQKGLAWLSTQQNSNGSFGSHFHLGNTAAAVLAFEEQGHLPGRNTMYSANVEKGLDFIFSKIYIHSIDPQPAGDPDSDGDGKGVVFTYTSGNYEIGLCMLAIVASKTPDRIVTNGKCSGCTYYEVIQDAVDYCAWAQNEPGNGRGGWRYSANDGNSDNSVSQWPVLGMMAAEKWNIFAPQWVKDELNFWVNYIQNSNGCSGYTSPTYIANAAKTGALMVEFYWLGDGANSPRAQKAINCISNGWGQDAYSEHYGNKGNPYAMFAIYKGLALLGVNTLPEPAEIDWWEDYKHFIVDNQILDGTDKGYWQPVPDSYNYGTWITTGWYISILQGTFFPGTIFVNLPDCTCDNAGYIVEIEYSYDSSKGFGVLNVYKDDELVETVDLIDFQGTATYTRYVDSDTPGEHKWSAVMYLATEDGKTAKAEGEASVNVYQTPILADIPNQDAPFEAFDLDNYLTSSNESVIWSVANVPEGWTVNIDANNVVTVIAPEKIHTTAAVTFTAKVNTACADVSCSNNDDAVFTSFPPILSDIPDVEFHENGSDSSIDLDDYVQDNSPDEEIKWTFAGNTNVYVSIAGDHLVTFTAKKAWSGKEVITFTATDPDSLFDSRSMTVTVIPRPRPTGGAYYDVPNTLLTIKFNKQIQPNLICFSGIGMEAGDSGSKDFQLSSDPNRDLHANEKGPTDEINVDINRDHPTTVNLAVTAFVSHKKVDLLMDEGTITDTEEIVNPEITGADDIKIQMRSEGLILGEKGDADGSGAITTYDAGLVLKSSVKGLEALPVFTPCQKVDQYLAGLGNETNTPLYTADWDGNGDLSSNDAAQMLQWLADNKIKAPNLATGPKLGELNINDYSNGKLDISVDLNNVSGVYSADIALSYDPALLEVSGVTNAYATSGWLLEELTEPGKVRIALAGADQPVANGSLVNISFNVKSADGINKLDIIELKLNGGNTKAEVRNPPKTFALLQNYPNPFNPETWIPYQLSSASNVVISIYNVNGQLVRRLDLGYKLPGYYVEKHRAVYWDGKNEIGEKVTSGIYFYQLQAGSESAVKKMIIAK